MCTLPCAHQVLPHRTHWAIWVHQAATVGGEVVERHFTPWCLPVQAVKPEHTSGRQHTSLLSVAMQTVSCLISWLSFTFKRRPRTCRVGMVIYQPSEKGKCCGIALCFVWSGTYKSTNLRGHSQSLAPVRFRRPLITQLVPSSLCLIYYLLRLSKD